MAPVNRRAAALLLLTYLRRRQRLRTRKIRAYVAPEHINRRKKGAFSTVVPDLRVLGPARHQKYFRMDVASFDALLNQLKGLLTKKKTHRMPISAGERLTIALRYLASGDDFTGLAVHYKVGYTTVRCIVWQVCTAIEQLLAPIVMPKVLTKEMWIKSAQGFLEKWQFPYCLAALDGKHVNMQKPRSSGSLYYNYKRRFSICLMGLVGPDYRFLAADIGAPGSASDGGVFAATLFGYQLRNGTANIPTGEYPLPGSRTGLRAPYVVVGDAGFPLLPHLMRPFPGDDRTARQKAFDYRLSRARRIVENAFGLIATKWRILHTDIAVDVKFAISIVHSCLALHNWLIEHQDKQYNPGNGLLDGERDDPDGEDGDWRVDQGAQLE